ncbi:MAG: stage III sporulation protein AF [Clostridia bacterium]|nr:stage III sporulation protein AF [Clostridia bacterium]MDD4375862.1 stage III sporulation protein AF [Clostridia bacterium]
MNIIKAFVEQMIYIAIVAILIEMILPKGRVKKYIHVILSLFVLLNIVSPIINVIADNDIDKTVNNVITTISSNAGKGNANIEEYNSYKNMKVNQTLKSSLEKDLKSKLKNEGVTLIKVELEINDKYIFDELKVNIGNLGISGEKKINKISKIIEFVANEYEIEEEKIRIIEEG